MILETELKDNKLQIQRKKREILESEKGSDTEYIRNLQTLIIMENSIDEKVKLL